VNKPLRKAAIFTLVLFALLMINANFVQVVKASSYQNHPTNGRLLLDEYSRARGPILVDGKPVAESVPTSGTLKYLREYPQGSTYAQATGYASIDYGETGIESAENSLLNGTDNRLFVSRLKDLFTGKQQQGGAVVLTLNAAAQQAAVNGLKENGGEGAVVAIQPSTGAILALASSPTFNPNELSTHDRTAAANAANALSKDKDQPLLDRATSETYPPGSVFKIVTAAAALQTGTYTNTTTPIPGAPATALPLPGTNNVLPNEDGETCASTSMTVALEQSCNSVYGYIGLKVGAPALQQEAESFGLNSFGKSNNQLKIPMSVAQSQFPTNLTQPGNQPFLAYSSIGQYNVQITPLQAAMITATVANNGVVMKPYLVDRELEPDTSVLSKTQPQQLSTAMSSENAQKIAAMMQQVVEGPDGTGAQARIPGISVAGKTGTAQRGAGQNPLAWFVSFAPVNNPQVAVAVLVEDNNAQRDEISGGGLAAPIAKSVMEAVLGR
jgi:peptidoglycan glycosyltransferase